VPGEIYLDNNATTRPLAEVRQTMFEALDDGFGNPSSEHARGQRARDALHVARARVASLVGADASQLVFTGSATEANNTVLSSAVRSGSAPPRIITSPVEHSSVLKACEQFAARGARIDYVGVDANGVIELALLERCLAAAPAALVSIQWANSETGVVQPVAEIGALCREHGVPLHVDAAQAVGKIDVQLAALPIDFASLTAHKIHGPVGVGAIYARSFATLRPLQFGGQQERGLRPGTENLPAVLGFGVAAMLRQRRFAEVRCQLANLRDSFERRVLSLVPDVFVNGQSAPRLSNVTNLRFNGVDGQALVARLDQAGVRCSQSSACTSQHPEPSYVLRAMGLTSDEAWSSVRFAFGEFNREQEVDMAAELIADICSQLRRFKVRRPVAQPVEVG
jgi:cysteine desulfurase